MRQDYLIVPSILGSEQLPHGNISDKDKNGLLSYVVRTYTVRIFLNCSGKSLVNLHSGMYVQLHYKYGAKDATDIL